MGGGGNDVVVCSRGGGNGAFLVGEKTADEGVLLVAETLDIRREADVECDNGNIITAGGEAGVAPAAGLPCSAEGVDGAGPGAEGVAAGQRRRSANAERDLRSCRDTSQQPSRTKERQRRSYTSKKMYMRGKKEGKENKYCVTK